MNQSRDSLKDLLMGTKPKSKAEEPPDDDVEFEEVGPCASRASVKWWPGFHVKRAKLISKKEPARITTRSFDYSHMGYREYGPGNTWFLLEINEPEKWRIRVEGRALWKLYNLLHQHRLEWIEPVTGNAGMGIPDGSPVIERITIERIEDDHEEEPQPASRGAGDEPLRARTKGGEVTP